MQINNATYLFLKPANCYHNAESFWTSVFALYILSGRAKPIPTYDFIINSGKWEFKPKSGDFSFEETPGFFDVVVEGKISYDSFEIDPPIELQALTPDIVIKRPGKHVSIVEIKTTGRHRLGEHQLSLYMKLFHWLKEVGWKPQFYLLLSAGHESKPDFELIRNREHPDKRQPHSIMLWEDVLELMSQSGGDIGAIIDRIDPAKQGLTDILGKVELKEPLS